MHQELLLDEFRRLVQGKTVALVGNSSSMLNGDKVEKAQRASTIDGHDVVIRMNLGVPQFIGTAGVGKRTDIWATAKFWPKFVPPDVKLMCFMKLTELGNLHFQKWLEFDPPCPLLRWPYDFENQVEQFVGAPPSTGIRMLWFLRKQCEPAHISLFGMDCWETKTHWRDAYNTPSHNPEMERRAMLELM